MFVQYRVFLICLIAPAYLLQAILAIAFFCMPQTTPTKNNPQAMLTNNKDKVCDQYGDPLPSQAIARMGTVRLRQPQPLGLAFSPHNDILACPDGAVIHLWNVRTGEEVRRILEYSNACIAFSPDGKTLAFAGSHGQIILWDVNSGQAFRTLIGHKEKVNAIAFAPRGNRLVSAGPDHVVGLWDATTGTRLWQFSNHQEEVCCLAFAANGQTLAVGTANGLIRLCDATTGRESQKPFRLGGALRALSFCPDGNSLASIGVTNTTLGVGEVNVWDIGSGKNVSKYKVQDLVHLTGLALAPDGRTVAIARFGANGVEIRSTAKDQVIGKCSIPNTLVTMIAYSSDANFLATGAVNSAIQIWDLRTGNQINPIGGHQHEVTSAAFAGKDKFIVTASKEGAILWDCQTGKQLLGLCGLLKYDPVIGTSIDGQLIAVGSETITVWDLAGQMRLRSLPMELLQQRGLSFSPDSRYVICRGSTEVLAFWDVVSGALKETSGTPLPLLESAVFDSPTLSVRNKLVTVVGFDRINLQLVIGQWDLTTMERKVLFHGPSTGPVDVVSVSPNGELLAYVDESDCIRLWQINTKREIRKIKAHQMDETKRRMLTALAWAPDGRTFATGGRDGSVRLWEVASGQERVLFSGHQSRIRAIAFSLDGTMLVSASDDTTALVWKTWSDVGGEAKKQGKTKGGGNLCR